MWTLISVLLFSVLLSLQSFFSQLLDIWSNISPRVLISITDKATQSLQELQTLPACPQQGSEVRIRYKGLESLFTITRIWTSSPLYASSLVSHMFPSICRAAPLSLQSVCPHYLKKQELHIIIFWGAAVFLRVSGALCGPTLMSHMWPVKKDPSDLAIRLITTQYILMSRVTSYTYNIHIHSTHAGSYMSLNETDIDGLLVICCYFPCCSVLLRPAVRSPLLTLVPLYFASLCRRQCSYVILCYTWLHWMPLLWIQEA